MSIARRFTGDSVRAVETWQDNPDIGKLSGKVVKVRFHIRDPRLYSFAVIIQRAKISMSTTPGLKDLRSAGQVCKIVSYERDIADWQPDSGKIDVRMIR